METCWQSTFLEALLALDEAEAPHGLYGIRRAYAKQPSRVPSLAQVLKAPNHPEVFRERGFKIGSSYGTRDRISFPVGTTQDVRIRVLDHASTKVRHFGSSYRLDLHNRKELREPDWDLKRLIPKLSPSGDTYRAASGSTQALLLIAHAPTVKGIYALLGIATDENFLQRYGVTLFQREWEDRYGRGFHSGVYLWSGRAKTRE